jgi:uncharacterized protein YndB with AHSA1/START domain
MPQKFFATATINARPSKVWAVLTDTRHLVNWIGDPEMKIAVQTDWIIGNPIIITGFHHVKFKNKGIVLKHIENKLLSYTHLSSVSRLPDKPGSYSTFEFILTPAGEYTTLTVTIENFPTVAIQKHLEFYWKSTVTVIKEYVEREFN